MSLDKLRNVFNLFAGAGDGLRAVGGVAAGPRLRWSPFASASVLLIGSLTLPQRRGEVEEVAPTKKKNPPAKAPDSSLFLSFCFPIRRRGMISLLARAKAMLKCVCGFLAVNEQTQTLLNGQREGRLFVCVLD